MDIFRNPTDDKVILKGFNRQSATPMYDLMAVFSAFADNPCSMPIDFDVNCPLGRPRRDIVVLTPATETDIVLRVGSGRFSDPHLGP